MLTHTSTSTHIHIRTYLFCVTCFSRFMFLTHFSSVCSTILSFKYSSHLKMIVLMFSISFLAFTTEIQSSLFIPAAFGPSCQILYPESIFHIQSLKVLCNISLLLFLGAIRSWNVVFMWFFSLSLFCFLSLSSYRDYAYCYWAFRSHILFYNLLFVTALMHFVSNYKDGHFPLFSPPSSVLAVEVSVGDNRDYPLYHTYLVLPSSLLGRLRLFWTISYF
jgi:hypothetical protein